MLPHNSNYIKSSTKQPNKDLVEYIVKKVDRSYSRIEKFLLKLNDQSIIKKKKIDYKLINEVLNEMV